MDIAGWRNCAISERLMLFSPPPYQTTPPIKSQSHTNSELMTHTHNKHNCFLFPIFPFALSVTVNSHHTTCRSQLLLRISALSSSFSTSPPFHLYTSSTSFSSPPFHLYTSSTSFFFSIDSYRWTADSLHLLFYNILQHLLWMSAPSCRLNTFNVRKQFATFATCAPAGSER